MRFCPFVHARRQVLAFMSLAFGSGFLSFPAVASEQLPGGIFSLCLASLPAPDPDMIWRAWSFAPQVAMPIVITCALYVRGLSQLAARSDPRRPTAIEVGFFIVGMLMLGVAVLSPLCRMASSLAWAHMLQHVILVTMVPPLILLGRPGAALSASLPAWGERILEFRGLAGHPVVAAVLYGAAIWFWHVPYFYQTALFEESVHLLMYGSLLAVSFSFWRGIVEAIRTPSEQSGPVAMSLLVTIIHTGLLGALLTFSQALWYPLVSAGGSWGISPLEDQGLAGLIMWVPMGMVYLVAGLVVVGIWLNALTEPKKPVSETPAARS